MRGYFGVGIEGVSKARNLGALTRTAHAFGASFFFTIEADVSLSEMRETDTSDAAANMPLYAWPNVDAFQLPADCALVGVEFADEAVELPSFRHPMRAAYVLGSERGSLSPALVERCSFLVRIPTRFCLNLGTAGAIVMYDRMIALGRFAERPVKPGGPVTRNFSKGGAGGGKREGHRWGGPLIRNRKPGEKSFLPE